MNLSQHDFTSKEFWRRHAPDFNFELNEKQLIEKALERGFIKRSGSIGSKWNEGGCTASELLYEYNPDYKSVTADEESGIEVAEAREGIIHNDEAIGRQRQVHGESAADQFIDDMMDEQVRPDNL